MISNICRLDKSLVRTNLAAASIRAAIGWVTSNGRNCSILVTALDTSIENVAACAERSMIAIRLVSGNRVTIQVAMSFIREIRSSSTVCQPEVGELSSTMAIATGSMLSIDGVGPDA